jgi:hypothetical protein
MTSRAIGTDHDGAGFAADRLGADVAGAVAEAIEIVAADVRLPARVADDDAVRLVVDGAAAFDDLPPLVVHVGDGRADHGASHDACADGQRRHVLTPRLWRWRELRCDRRRCRKAGWTVGGAYCALPGGGAAAGVPGTTLGAAAPAGGSFRAESC